jgi:hypothetical protein
MLEARISAMVCLNGLPSTSSSTVRYLIFPSRLPLQKRLGEVGEIAPGVNAVPFGAGCPYT